MDHISTTLDGLLNRRVTLEQPTEGYRVAMDTVFLAAAVPALAGDRVLDLGCGVGGAFLCLACRVEGVSGLGLDIQPDLVDLAQSNIKRNAFASGFEVQQSDVTLLPPDMRDRFDHVLMNPPYHEETRHDVSADKIKRTANSEKPGDLALWIASAAAALKPSGTLTLIHRADRSEEILSALQKSFGDVLMLPLCPKPGVDAKRIIVRARKQALFSVRTSPAFILHKESGGYTDAAEAVLRHAQAVAFASF